MSATLLLQWGTGRPSADLDVATGALISSLEILREHVGLDSPWHRSGDGAALDGPGTIRDTLTDGVNRADTTQEPIRQLGHTLFAASGQGTDRASLEVSVGGWGRTWRGRFVVTLRNRPVPTQNDAVAALTKLVQVWQPDHAAWTSPALLRASWQSGVPRDGLAVGWVTWVPDGAADPFHDDGEPAPGGTIHVLAPTWAQMTLQEVSDALGAGDASTSAPPSAERSRTTDAGST